MQIYTHCAPVYTPIELTVLGFYTGSKLVRNQNHMLLMDTLKSLESIMKERLLMTPAEERDKKMYLTDVINREMKTNATREKLEIKYNAAVKAKESEVEY